MSIKPVIVATYKHIVITHFKMRKERESWHYWITTRRGNVTLGEIRYYSQWKQFCFFPERGTVWSDDCLRNVRDFMKTLV